jgi:hypothetical protein
MAYFIFRKDLNDIPGSIYCIAENQSDLNNLNIISSDYKIIEDNQINFENVKYGTKTIEKYNDNIITYIDTSFTFENKEALDKYITNLKIQIKLFIENNNTHPLFNIWNIYYNQLSNLDLNSIIYPLNKSLEQYFKDLNQTSLHPLQLP